MNFVVGPMLMSVIQAKYAGGLDKFREEGGMVGLAPGSTKEVVVHHPGLPEALKKDIREFLGKWKLTARFAAHTNGKSISEEELRQEYGPVIEEVLSMLGVMASLISIHPLMVVITLLDETVTQSKVQELVETLTNRLPSLWFGYVIYVDGVCCIEREFKDDSYIMLEQLKRDTVIGEDDILNLKIALGNAQTIDDFINSI
jgi:hypothetical protein